MNIDELCVNSIRALSVDMITNAHSGHPGSVIDLAPAAHILYSNFFNFEPEWPNRDRFILSSGHAVPLLYTMHHLLGGKEKPVVSIDDLKKYRKMGSRTSGSTEHHVFPEIVECSTGPLGQGFANAIGFSVISLHLQKRFNKPDIELFNNRIWCFCGDGDMMEGVQAEAASFAGHQKLNNLVVFYDNNKVTLSGRTDMAFTEDVLMRYRSYGWHTIVVENADTDYNSIKEAIQEAISIKDKPVLIELHTTIGYGSENEDTCKMHGTPLTNQQLSDFKKHFGLDPNLTFNIPNEVYEYYQNNVRQNRILPQVSEWNQKFELYKRKYESDYHILHELINGGTYNLDFFKRIFTNLNSYSSSNPPKYVSTREFSHEVLNAVSKNLPGLIGGSPDLTPTTNTSLDDQIEFNFSNREGRYIQFGIREHSMQAIANGISCYGFNGITPFTCTFLAFYNYMLPSLRVAAIDSLRMLVIASHDSIGVGEDGATSQPVECLAQLRATPNTAVFRPCDGTETCAGYAITFCGPKRPTILVFSRQPTEAPVCGSDFNGATRGGYVIKKFIQGEICNLPKVVLIATGTEVALALKASKILSQKFNVQVVSLPCFLLFDEQDDKYRESVLPHMSDVLRVSIEAGVGFGWCKYSHRHIGVERFGFSASYEDLYREFGLYPESIAEKVEQFAADFFCK